MSLKPTCKLISSNPPTSKNTARRMATQAPVTAESVRTAKVDRNSLDHSCWQNDAHESSDLPGQDHAAMLNRLVGINQLCTHDTHIRPKSLRYHLAQPAGLDDVNIVV